MKNLILIPTLVLVVACNDEGEPTSTANSSATDASETTSSANPSTSTGAGGESTEGATASMSSSSSSLDGTSDSGSSEGTGAAAPTWENFAEGFLETYCWECHGPGDALRDYSVLAEVMAEASSIRCGTAPVGSMLDGCAGEPPAGQFPIGTNLPSDEERAILVQWIEAGLPEN